MAPKISIVAALVAFTLSVSGCSSSDESSADSNGGGGSAGKPATPTQLEFDPETTLTMVPGDVRSIALDATPPAIYRVRFSLLGDYKDASLDKSEIDTDENGHATVLVTAPKAATTFRVRASVSETISTEVGVSVSASGFGTLQVDPIYAGKRSVSYWTASVRTGTTCAALSGEAPSDGDLKGTAPSGQHPQIDGVPVGPALAVTIRGAYSVAGCKDLSDLRAGEVTQVSVDVADLPMKLTETDLVVALGLDAQKADLSSLLDSTTALAALDLGANDDIDALLDAMQASTADPSAASTFESARATGAWDLALVTALGGPGLAPKAIKSLVGPWLAEGAQAIPGPETFQGRLISSGQAAGYSMLSIDTVAGTNAQEAGLAPVNLATWQGEPDDTVALGTTLFFIPSRLVTALAKPPAQKDAPGANSVPEALSMLLSCDVVAQTLVASGSAPSEAFTGCNEMCVHSLCESALEKLWQNARDASPNDVGATATLSIAATGAAGVDDFARPTGFAGSWVGALNLDANAISVGGPASAAKPPPPF